MVESLLRMRGNTIIVGTTGFPDEATFRIADRRDVHIAEHHMTPLGLNVWGWPTGLTYSYRLAPDLLQFAWRSLVGLQKVHTRSGEADSPCWLMTPLPHCAGSRHAVECRHARAVGRTLLGC